MSSGQNFEDFHLVKNKFVKKLFHSYEPTLKLFLHN